MYPLSLCPRAMTRYTMNDIYNEKKDQAGIDPCPSFGFSGYKKWNYDHRPMNTEAEIWMRNEIRKRFKLACRICFYKHNQSDHAYGGEVF